MKAVRISDYGADPVLEEAPVPGFGPDEVLVRVAAAALNPLDLYVQSGASKAIFPITFPFTLASDFSGTIEQVGADVADWKVGDRVIVAAEPIKGGGLADYAAVPATRCAPLPADLSFEEGAGIPVAASTAWLALFETGKLQAGETILIHAAAGGVGTFAVQFAHKAGAHVIASTSGDGLALVRDLGADQVIDRETEDFASLSQVDVVLDPVGGETQVRSYGVLRPGGRLVSIISPPDEALAAEHGVSAAMFYLHLDGETLRSVVAAIAAHGIKPVIDSHHALADYAQAWERLKSRQGRGKIIIGG